MPVGPDMNSMPFRNSAIKRITEKIKTLQEKDDNLVKQHLDNVDTNKKVAYKALRKSNRVGPRILRLQNKLDKLKKKK